MTRVCGNCRFHAIDEHGGGRNRCTLLEESERYKYPVNHSCDTPIRLVPGGQSQFIPVGQEVAFMPNYWRMDCLVEDLQKRILVGHFDTQS